MLDRNVSDNLTVRLKNELRLIQKYYLQNVFSNHIY